MVKVIEKTPEEIREEQRTSKLVAIAKQILPEANIDVNPTIISISGKDYHLFVSLSRNYINAQDKQTFEQAMKLAEVYEAQGEPEFTVKKDYTE